VRNQKKRKFLSQRIDKGFPDNSSRRLSPYRKPIPIQNKKKPQIFIFLPGMQRVFSPRCFSIKNIFHSENIPTKGD
jgi:hypothetical protein